jgi:hypothetical protein
MAHMCGLVIAFCIACEWIGLLLLRLLVIFSQRMGEDENTSHCVLEYRRVAKFGIREGAELYGKRGKDETA